MKATVLSITMGIGILCTVGIVAADESRFLEPRAIQKIETRPPQITDDRFVGGTISRVEVPCASITNDRFFCAVIAQP